MATVCVKILPHHLKADGSYNVKIRITHKMVKRYIDTEHFVTQKQLTKKLTLKDPFIEEQLNQVLIYKTNPGLNNHISTNHWNIILHKNGVSLPGTIYNPANDRQLLNNYVTLLEIGNTSRFQKQGICKKL